MAISLKPRHWKRYRDLLALLAKYGRSDLIPRNEIEGAEFDEPSRPSAEKRSPEDTSVDDKPTQLANDLEAMGPTFIKVGQFLSTRADLLPPPYLEALARLQDKIAPFPFADVERIVSEDLGVRLSKAFLSFDEEPLASASLGQVHRAVLRSGLDVAVKVQRPDVRDTILEDLEALGEIATWLDAHTEVGKRYGFVPMLEEFRKSLLRELDYRQEARHLQVLGENLADFDLLVVPSPVDDFVTARVLAMEFIRGRKVTSVGPLARMEIDGAPLAEELCRAYMRQMLVDGFFHADPHPGNVFLTDDGRLALLDLGMVGRLTPTLQESLLKLVLAVSESRGEDAAELAVQIGQPLPGCDEPLVRRRIVEIVTRLQGLHLHDMQVGRMFFEIARVSVEGRIRLPRELTLVAKTLLNVDQVSRHLDPEFDPNAAIRRNAAEIMRHRMLKGLSPGKLFAGMLEMKEFVERLPARLNGLIDAVAHNRVRIQVDAIDEVLLMEGLQKIANRITLGLVISALIVGAALLMRIETRFRIFGYPGLAIVFFLAAAISGLYLVFNIVSYDIRSRKDKLENLMKTDRQGPASKKMV